jgi:TDG/mug DNA glycosylase family protein
MGQRVQTLEDLLRPALSTVCVGINPSLVSVEAGHYYQGRLGKLFFSRLRRVAVLPAVLDGYEDDAL